MKAEIRERVSVSEAASRNQSIYEPETGMLNMEFEACSAEIPKKGRSLK